MPTIINGEEWFTETPHELLAAAENAQAKYEALEGRVEQAKKDAIKKALDALGRYKFEMFGYWASKWVSLNKLSDKKDPNPFRELVWLARWVDDE